MLLSRCAPVPSACKHCRGSTAERLKVFGVLHTDNKGGGAPWSPLLLDVNPEWIWGICIIVLCIALACVMLFSRKRSSAARALRDRETKKLYDEENHKDEARQH